MSRTAALSGRQARIYEIGDGKAGMASANLHYAAAKAMDFQMAYVPKKVAGQDLASSYRALCGDARGFSIAPPYKGDVVMLLDELDDDARSIGACNLIACEDGRFKGYNSEWEALLAVLKRREMRPRLNRAMVIGTGAAARAAMYALWRGGFSRMTLAGRNTARAGAIVRGLGFIMGVDAKVVRYPDEASLVDVGQIDLVVNATPLGREDEDPLGGRELRVGLDVVDLAAPDEGTALSRRAEAAGCRVVKGTEVGAEVARLDVATWSKGA